MKKIGMMSNEAQKVLPGLARLMIKDSLTLECCINTPRSVKVTPLHGYFRCRASIGPFERRVWRGKSLKSRPIPAGQAR